MTPRATAQSRGEKRYTTSRPCIKGHYAPRVTKTGNCTACLADTDAMYMRAHRARNPGKAAEYQRNRRKEHPESVRNTARASKMRHRAKYTFWQNARRASQLQRTPSWADATLIEKIYAECPQGMEVDHIIPLQGRTVSGLHVPNNLQYLTPQQNQQKGNRI